MDTYRETLEVIRNMDDDPRTHQLYDWELKAGMHPEGRKGHLQDLLQGDALTPDEV